MHVGSVTLEVRMCLYLDLDHEVAGRTTESGVALLGDAQVHARVDTLRYVDRLLNLLISQTLASACRARVAYHCALTITVAANLLDHEGTLAYSLETSSTARAACALSSARLRLRSLACTADVCSREGHGLLRALHGVHEVYLDWYDNVAPALASLRRASRATARPLLLSEELLELFEYVTERTLSGSATSEGLVLESLESGEPAEAAAKSSERVATGLLLLIASHSSAVVDALLLLVTERLICFIDLGELFFGARALVHIRMILFSFLKVSLLNFTLRRVSVAAEYRVIVFASTTPIEMSRLNTTKHPAACLILHKTASAATMETSHASRPTHVIQ